MERVGDVRMTRSDGIDSAPLRPGETVPDNRQVTAGKGSLLVLSKNGFQLTAGEHTSFSLPIEGATPGVFLDRGWLRIRLTRAVDQEVRIKTAEFDINASRAMLTLRTDPQGTSLTVDDGSAILATTDGRHRATLVAGAAAKMDSTSGDDLLIQPASGRGFTKVSPLPSAGDAGQRPEADLVIRPASKSKKPHINRLEAPAPNASTSSLEATPVASPSLRSTNAPRPSMDKDVIPSSMPEIDDDEMPTATPYQPPDDMIYDPLALQFERLTKGLVDDL